MGLFARLRGKAKREDKRPLSVDESSTLPLLPSDPYLERTLSSGEPIDFSEFTQEDWTALRREMGYTDDEDSSNWDVADEEMS